MTPSRKGTRRSAPLISVLAFSLAAGLALQAQNRNPALRIEVKDPSGHGMKASGHLRSLSAGSDVKFETDRTGTCSFSDLQPGRYRIEISNSGFATQTVALELKPGMALTRSFSMALAPVAAKIDVIAPTPLPGTDLPIEDIPAPVQTANGRDIAQSGSLNLSDFMNRRLQGVHINENQSNPFQPDVNSTAVILLRRCSAHPRASRFTSTVYGRISLSATSSPGI